MDTITVTIAGAPAALCTPTAVYFADWVDGMPDQHPDRQLAAAKALLAGEVLAGQLPGPWDDHAAEQLAREMLTDLGPPPDDV